MKSLRAQNHPLSKTEYELEVLESKDFGSTFQQKLQESGLFPFQPKPIEILQLNLGKMCNQVCKHCHVDAGPDRKEIMDKDTMELCLQVLRNHPIQTVDLTGGAPEMNSNFRWLVTEIRKISQDINILVRCNLTIIMANPKYHDLPEFFKENRVEVISSLPYFTALKTDAQRGDGVFEKSIQALQMLNKAGYGMPGSGLKLQLVYNPAGAFLPASQEGLEAEFKKRLLNPYGIHFNSLYTITNLPISRFLEYLLRSGNYDSYMQKLVEAYNPLAAANAMCRNTLSVGWDGYLYDCDFNQMLDLKVACQDSQHIREWNLESLGQRSIVVNQHCFGCTAGAGSSCGGATA